MALTNTAMRRSPGSGFTTPPAPRHGASGRAVGLWAAGLSALMIGSLVLGVAFEQFRFVIWAPEAQAGVEAAAALARLFAALVLFMFPNERTGQRLRWIASGFVVLAIGGLLFGYAPPLLNLTLDLNTLLYASLLVRTTANAFFVVGLLPGPSLPLVRPALLSAVTLFAVLSVASGTGTHLLPPLVEGPGLGPPIAADPPYLPGLTLWHAILSMLPLVLAVAAMVFAVHHYRAGIVGGWLVVAMVLLTGTQLHTIPWPSMYSPILTTEDLLRLAFAGVVAVGAILELRRIAVEREALLAAEREQTRRLGELAVLKADFTAMVAHELGNPIATVRGFAQVLATGQLGPDEQAEAIAVIQSEMDVLTTLLADMQTAATVERDDFAVRLRPAPVATVLADAATFGRSLPANHPFTCTMAGPDDVLVRADQYRIGQVLRNLLSNAAKYSRPGTPIELRCAVNSDRVRLEVVDQGHGIHPDDLTRVFEKFGRGRDEAGRKIPGVGLGLYLSRRIIQAHGADLEVRSELGVGSVFGFELEMVDDSSSAGR